MNGHGGGGILLARGGGQLLTCVVCRKPTPPEHIAPTNPREGVCGDCWAKVGNIRNWWRQPCLSNGLPVLDVFHLMLAPYTGQRGDDRNGIRTLARLLDERERLLEWLETGEPVLLERCCYCGACDFENKTLIVVEGNLPLWRCADFEACDPRVFQRIMLMVAGVIQGQEVPT